MYISKEQLTSILNAIEKCTSNNTPIIILTCLSIAVAIGIPCYIAYQQNKIALYDKRLEAYQQFLALKSFYEYIKEDSSDGGQYDTTTLDKWRGMYLSLHYSMLDKNYQHSHLTLQNVYVLAAVDRNRNMLSSLEHLGILHDGNISKNVATALENFIEELFGIKNFKSETILQEKGSFESEFSKLMDCEEKFKRALRMTRIF